jgi:nucleoside-diphosphate-sugar epimerase
MKVLILGGTRFIGRRVAEMLVATAADVTLFHRGISGSEVAGTETIIGDRSSAADMNGLRASRPDVVIDLSSYSSEWTKLAVSALSGRVGQYVYVSSGAVYRPSPELPWPETTTLGPDPFWGQYAHEKVQSERILWSAQADGALSVTIFRYPFVLGPGNYADREAFVLSRIESGRPLLLPGGGTAINQHVYVDDAAGAIVAAVMDRDASAGQAYNCAFPRGVTNRGFVELCAAVLGTEAQIVPIDEAALGLPTDSVDLTNLVFPFPNRHYMLDSTRLATDLGFRCRVSTRQMIEEFAAWWREREDHTPRKYAHEEQALERLPSSVMPRARGGEQ